MSTNESMSLTAQTADSFKMHALSLLRIKPLEVIQQQSVIVFTQYSNLPWRNEQSEDGIATHLHPESRSALIG